MSRIYKILALVGDGIAEEIVPEAIKVLQSAEEVYGFELEILGPYGFGAKYWIDHDMERSFDPACRALSVHGKPLAASVLLW